MTTSTKRVLFIIPSLARAGAETQVVDLVNALDPMRFKKYLLTFEKNLDQLGRVDQGQIEFYNHQRKYKYDFSVAREIAIIIDREQIDLVHCSLQIALLLGWLGVRLSNRRPPLVLAVHTTVNVSKGAELLDKYVYQWLMRGCRKVIFVCKTQEAYWRAKYPSLNGKTRVIYNGVDTDYFSPESLAESGGHLRQMLGISPEARVICHIAGFRPEKGHAILLMAFAEVLRQVPEAYLVFAGDGSLRTTVSHRAKELGVEEKVRFLGSIADVRPVLAASDISVLASTAVETFSIAMLESMAMGVPMVATDMGGAAEAVLQGETGMIVPPGDHGELARALTSLLLDDVRRQEMGEAARKLVQARFTKQGMILGTGALIDQCMCQ